MNEFDRLLIPKHERIFQQLVVKIFDYVKFSLLYLLISFFLSFVFSTTLLEGIRGVIFFGLVNLTFLFFHLLLFPKIIINEFDWIQKIDNIPFNKLKTFYGKQNEKILNGNLILSILVFTFLLGNPLTSYANYNLGYLVFLFFVPMYLLFICRALLLQDIIVF